MFKLLLWGILLVYLYRRWFTTPITSHTQRTSVDAVNMVKCARCGVFVPSHEAHGRAGAWFCSLEHQRDIPSHDA